MFLHYTLRCKLHACTPELSVVEGRRGERERKGKGKGKKTGVCVLYVRSAASMRRL